MIPSLYTKAWLRWNCWHEYNSDVYTVFFFFGRWIVFIVCSTGVCVIKWLRWRLVMQLCCWISATELNMFCERFCKWGKLLVEWHHHFPECLSTTIERSAPGSEVANVSVRTLCTSLRISVQMWNICSPSKHSRFDFQVQNEKPVVWNWHFIDLCFPPWAWTPDTVHHVELASY